MQFFKFYYSSDELVVFVDESGDELTKDPRNPVFVLACCIVKGSDLTSFREKWLDVREAFGGRDKPIHMRKKRSLGQKATKAVVSFFQEMPFYRASVTITASTVFVGTEEIKKPGLQAGLGLLNQIMAKLISGAPSQGLAVVMEETKHRRDELLRIMARYQLTMDGQTIPVCWSLLDKNDEEPGLEVADFMSHTVAGFERGGRSDSSRFYDRFQAIFSNKERAISWRLEECERTGEWRSAKPDGSL